MNNGLVSKYYLRVQKDILDYSLLLTALIKLKEPPVITKNEIIKQYQSIINIFFDKYKDDSPKANLLVFKYFTIDDDNPLVDNRILASIIKYYENNNNILYLKRNKKYVITTALILSLAFEVWEMTNPFKKRVNDIKAYVVKRLMDIDELSYLNTKIDNETKLNALLEYSITAYNQNKKFFKSFNSNTSYNTFIDLTSEDKYFLTNYVYVIDELTKYRPKDVNKVLNGPINESLFFIQCNLLSVLILKELLCYNNDKYYILMVNNKVYHKNKNIDNLNVIFSNQDVKNNLYLMITYKDYISDSVIMSRLRNYGFNLLIDTTDSVDIGNLIRTVNIKDTVLISKESQKTNLNYLSYMKEKKINILVENRNRKIMKNNF